LDLILINKRTKKISVLIVKPVFTNEINNVIIDLSTMLTKKHVIESNFLTPQTSKVTCYYKADSKDQLMISCVSTNSPVVAEKPILTHSGKTLLRSTTTETLVEFH